MGEIKVILNCRGLSAEVLIDEADLPPEPAIDAKAGQKFKHNMAFRYYTENTDGPKRTAYGCWCYGKVNGVWKVEADGIVEEGAIQFTACTSEGRAFAPLTAKQNLVLWQYEFGIEALDYATHKGAVTNRVLSEEGIRPRILITVTPGQFNDAVARFLAEGYLPVKARRRRWPPPPGVSYVEWEDVTLPPWGGGETNETSDEAKPKNVWEYLVAEIRDWYAIYHDKGMTMDVEEIIDLVNQARDEYAEEEHNDRNQDTPAR